MAGLYPDTPRAIVLEDPPSWWVKTPTSEFLQRAGGIKEWASQLKSKTREQIIAEGRAQNPLWSDAELDPWADSKLSFSLNAMMNLFTPHHTAGIVWAETLQRISCPVLVVTADLARGAALAPAGVDALKALVPHLQVEHIANAGHSIRREQFAHYVEVVRAFLADIPAA
jgi:pimeloyl-ACP methyl ester carboxylesterase